MERHRTKNYERSIEKYPKTQTLEPIWKVKSGAFMTSKKIYKECMVRIGLKTYLFQLREEISFDIDCLPDFRMAEVLYQSVR